ncbi:hypothetical protein, partial [Streptomyces barringtoniae]|uniref:hypothetical protein n=1 Tax=Streptomyces barringtoniae TaxID=2892029 RepID=UPI001E2C5AAA
EPPWLSWDSAAQKPADVTGRALSRSETERFRSGKLVNLYGQAWPVHDVNDFPLLPGHGTPDEITYRYLPAPTDSAT